MKDKANKKCSPFGIKAIIIFVVLNLAFILGATLFFLDYSRCLKIQKAIDNGIIVEAEIVYLDKTSAIPHGVGHSYDIICRYVDENGIIYECPCGRGTSSDTEQKRKVNSVSVKKWKFILVKCRTAIRVFVGL